MKNLFIGGFFPDNQLEMIENSSIGDVQNAAHVFQTNLLSGFDKVFADGVDVINLPFVGAFPKGFNKLYYPKTSFDLFENTAVKSVGFLNLVFTKHVSRFFALLFSFFKIGSANYEFIFIYSFHLPFIAAAVLAKKIRFRNTKVCLIVPDLPEYMSDSNSVVYKALKKIDRMLLNKLSRYIDLYILLTKEMAIKLNLNDEQYVVIEGIASNLNVHYDITERDKKFIFYSGTLAQRYGVRELVDAFAALKTLDYELLICGSGDSKEYIENAEKYDKRIKYLGQMSREKAVNLQQSATVLVNPRGPEGEYTKYSFPSKVMEYMSSGRPVIMHKLPGIPEEYFKYCFTPDAVNTLSFKECLENTLKLSEDELTAVGSAAREFVLNNKSDFKQAEKIKNFLMRNI